VNTLMAMRGAVAASGLDCFAAYVDAVFRHMWAEPKKMDNPAVYRHALLQSGLGADRILALIQTAEVKQTLMESTERSVARGTFGSPTFFIGGEMWFGKDRLRDVEDAPSAPGNGHGR